MDGSTASPYMFSAPITAVDARLDSCWPSLLLRGGVLADVNRDIHEGEVLGAHFFGGRCHKYSIERGQRDNYSR